MAEPVCDNYLPPLTCLTAPSSDAGTCDKCKMTQPEPGTSPSEERLAEIRARWESGYESMTGMHADVQALLDALAAERERAERAEAERDAERDTRRIQREAGRHLADLLDQAEAAVERLTDEVMVRDQEIERLKMWKEAAHERADAAEAAVEQRDAVIERATAVIRELVELKDGPRDADYERRKPLAWEMARAWLRRAALDQPGDTKGEKGPVEPGKADSSAEQGGSDHRDADAGDRP